MINDILNRLKETSSTLKKIEILKENSSNELLKNIISETLCPLKTFGIKKIPVYTNESVMLSLYDAVNELNKFKERILTGNNAINHLKFILSNLNVDDAIVFEKIILKDLKCGVSTATANKVWNNLISDYPVMLCSPNKDGIISNINYPAIGQTKSDGMRFNCLIRDGKVSFHSRNGKEYCFNGRLVQDFINLGLDNHVFDGELLFVNETGVLDRKTGNGLIVKGLKGTITDEESDNIHVVLWDVISLDSFDLGYSKLTYNDRFKLLNQLTSRFSNKLSIVYSKLINNIDEAQEMFADALANGQEGIILKNIDSYWENKRVKHQIKFKNEIEGDFEVVDWLEGTNKNIGKLGALTIKSKCGTILCDVGSGFTDLERISIKKDVIGKIVCVKFNEIITDKKKTTKSLFLPIFIEIRTDKTEADYFR